MVGKTSTRLQTLQALVTKHISDPAYANISTDEDFSVTSTERGLSRYEHPHLVAALDCLLIYQKDRRAAAGPLGVRYTYTHDPRTRMIELLKRWLRSHAVNRSLGEEDVARVSNLCRDLLNHSDLFPSRNSRSFMRTMADVYDHLQRQLREVLEHDRTCAELAARVLSLSRNLVSDAVAFLILGPTSLTQTDKLASLEVVTLWQSIPSRGTPLPKSDEAQQSIMKEAWQSYIGALIADILSAPWTIRLFHGSDGLASARPARMIQDGGKPTDDAPTRHPVEDMREHIAWVEAEFDKGNFGSSGFAGPFRQPELAKVRSNYLLAVQNLFDMLYLLGEVLTQFHRISDGLGDYGLIRLAPWLHPCLESMVEKVQRLKVSLEELNEAVDAEIVLAKARGMRPKKPRPTELMSARAHSAIERAITGRDCHVQVLLTSLKELRERSSPERLPYIVDGLGTACLQLQGVLESPQFRKCIGEMASEFPPLQTMGAASTSSFPVLEAITAGSPDLGTGYSSEEVAEALSDESEGEAMEILGRVQARRKTEPIGEVLRSPKARAHSREPELARTESREDERRRAISADAPRRAISMDFIEAPSEAADGDARLLPPLQSPHGEIRAEVWRMTESWRQAYTLKRRDQRGLLLAGRYLHIFDKGSINKVKTKVDVSQDIDECYVMSDGTLVIKLRRSASDGGSVEEKGYFFQFDNPVSAGAFHGAIKRLVETGTW